MKVLIVTPYENLVGGVEIVTKNLVNGLREFGYTVNYLTIEKKPALPFVTQIQKIIYGPPAVTSFLYKKIDPNFYDAVICNGEYAWGISHKNIFVYFHGSYLGLRNSLPKFSLLTWLKLSWLSHIQRVSSINKKVVSVSHFLSSILKKQKINVDCVLSSPIDIKKFSPQKKYPEHDFIFVGRNDYYGKGIDRLEKIAARGYKIHCYTNGKLHDLLTSFPFVSNKQMPEIYSRYKILLSPSRFESYGMALGESLACGVPILTTSVGLASEISREIPDFIVKDYDNIDEVEKKIKNILDNYNDFAQRARKWAENNLSHEKYIHKWKELICGGMENK